jgi:hypothetical protein
MPEASVTVIVVELEPDPNPHAVQMVTAARPFYAYMASNPRVRADGETEEDALERLKHLILTHHPPARRRRVVDLQLSELIVEEVMRG